MSISQPVQAAEPSASFSARLVAIGYVVVGTLIAVAAVVSILVGRDEHPAPGIAGFYTSTSTCLGTGFKLASRASSSTSAAAPVRSSASRTGGSTGDVSCVKGGSEAADLAVQG